ncbi:hypothetical protein ILUMI_19363 [Ignelater luminosus]|uniref:Uncharacterized protein n=1 Tax=Ignelater luminosus TaxID=2038154 RepID=A0A8K0CN84_IGNLU|nr:hypothetical protein ILUMI_19363 [Ignelater luminosus]
MCYNVGYDKHVLLQSVKEHKDKKTKPTARTSEEEQTNVNTAKAITFIMVQMQLQVVTAIYPELIEMRKTEFLNQLTESNREEIEKAAQSHKESRRWPKLEQGAVPHIFEKLPIYLTTSLPVIRTNPEERRSKRLQREADAIEAFVKSDLIGNFEDLVKSLNVKVPLKN